MYSLWSVKSMFAQGKLNKDEACYIFDWMKAAELISKTQPKEAYAQAKDKQLIYKNGEPITPDDIIMSKEKPVLIMDDKEPIPCGIKEYKTETFCWTDECVQKLTLNSIKTKEQKENDN